ncbi:MAG TPA: Uma2 family endonuclease [Chloroflexota bacterium]|nr:Uma2 family endonuclease [Chloroflexota bacterium]
MVAQQQGPLWTVEQYLDLERNSTTKHEYHGGYVYAMSGGSQAHSQIAGNVYALLRAGVRGSGCRALNPDIKVRQSPSDYVYADAVVTCDPRDDRPGQDWIEYPTLIVEVLSPSTERHDRGAKFEGYTNIETLREYLLIEYRQREVEVRRRDESGSWTSTTFGPGQDVPLTSLALTLPMDLIYEDSGT